MRGGCGLSGEGKLEERNRRGWVCDGAVGEESCWGLCVDVDIVNVIGAKWDDCA